MYNDCDIILPVTVPNVGLWAVSSMCIRSARASSDANIIVLLNNSEPDLADDIRSQCMLLDIVCEDLHGPFSLSKAYNRGAALGTSKYIAYGQCDILFFHGWLDRLVELWEEQPEYYVVWPFTFSTSHYGQSYRDNPLLERRIVDDGFPQGALSVFRRSDGYKWDEHFAWWELDADLSLYMQRNNLKGGLCLWSRVDHLPQTVRKIVDMEKHFGVEHMGNSNSESNRYLKEKWALRP